MGRHHDRKGEVKTHGCGWKGNTRHALVLRLLSRGYLPLAGVMQEYRFTFVILRNRFRMEDSDGVKAAGVSDVPRCGVPRCMALCHADILRAQKLLILVTPELAML